MTAHLRLVVCLSAVISLPLAALAASQDQENVVLRLDGTLTAPASGSPAVAATRSGLAPGSTVIELRCGWQRSDLGTKDLMGSCKPPACPGGWSDLGPLSCGANGVACVEGCLVVGDCSRFCSN